MRTRTLTTLLATLCFTAPAYGKRTALEVVVADPYIEMHTGPGRGYPIFHVADRGAEIQVIKRRTDWFQVQTDRGVKGWVHMEQLARTLAETGEPVEIADPGWDDFSQRRWDLAVQLGDFDGANAISLTGGYRLTANLAAELSATHISGDFSDGWMANARLVHMPFPEWRIAPFLMLGTGVVHISPKATLVSTEDRTDQVAQAGAGVRAYLTRRFLFRAEYSGYVAFTSRDENEEVEEWKAGFAFFF